MKTAWEARVEKFKKSHLDWDDVINQIDIPLAPYLQAVIFDMEDGPKLAYFLGKNRECAVQISKMRPDFALIEIGKLSAKLEGFDD